MSDKLTLDEFIAVIDELVALLLKRLERPSVATWAQVKLAVGELQEAVKAGNAKKAEKMLEELREMVDDGKESVMSKQMWHEKILDEQEDYVDRVNTEVVAKKDELVAAKNKMMRMRSFVETMSNIPGALEFLHKSDHADPTYTYGWTVLNLLEGASTIRKLVEQSNLVDTQSITEAIAEMVNDALLSRGNEQNWRDEPPML